MIKLNSCYIFDIIEKEIINNDVKSKKQIDLPVYIIVNKKILFLSNYIINLNNDESLLDINELKYIIYKKYIEYLSKLNIVCDNKDNVFSVIKNDLINNKMNEVFNEEFESYLLNNNLCGKINIK